MLKNKLQQLRQLLQKRSERLVLYSSLPAICKIFLIDLALWSDHKVWFGALWQLPKFWVRAAAVVGQKHQLNQLGNSALIPTAHQNFMQKIELQVVEFLRRQLNASKTITGYCTSGGTEANIFLLWLARSFFEKHGVVQSIVFGTALTHYSVTKAARLLQMPFETVAVDSDYTMSAISLVELLRRHYKKGVRGFALVITWGYSSTGGCDNWVEIEPILSEFKKQHADVEIFVWIDAAAQGLPLLYLSPAHAKPFDSPLIQGYVLDYHKFGGAPIGAGMVLYKKSLVRAIETPIPYLLETDATLLGSRPGAAVLAIWSSQQVYSPRFWKQVFERQLKIKQNWLLQMQHKYRGMRVVTHEKSLTLALALGRGFRRLNQTTERMHALHPIRIVTKMITDKGLKSKVLRHYKLHFLARRLPLW